MRAQLTVPLSGTIVLRFQGRLYTMEEKVDIIRPNLSMIGEKVGKRTESSVSVTTAGMTTLYWPNGGSTGLDIMYPGRFTGGTYGDLVVGSDAAARGDHFYLRGMALIGPGGSLYHTGEETDYGIDVHVPCKLEDFVIRGFRGDGIHINASVAQLGNVNGALIQYGSIYGNGGYGTFVAGGDANQIQIQGITYTDNGYDLPARGGDYTIAVGQEIDTITVNNALTNTLYRLVVGGTNCDYTTPGSGVTTSTIAAGLAAAVNAAVVNQAASQTGNATLVVYGTNNASFTCTTTGSVGSLTVAVTAETTASPQHVYCFDGPANSRIRLNDSVSGYIEGGSYHGWLLGDVDITGDGYGYLRASTAPDQMGYSADSLSIVSGSTARLTILNYRSGPAINFTGRSVEITGAANEANNGTFTTTRILTGVYSATSVRFRVVVAKPGESTWVVVNGTWVPVTFDAGDTTVSLCKDRIVSAINTAAISGVTATVHDTDEFNVVGTDIIVQNGPYIQQTSGLSHTIIEYTNASAVAEPTFGGYFLINARVGTRGVYTGHVYGRGAQAMDVSLIGGYYANCLANGPAYGEAYHAKSGFSVFEKCYVEGFLQSPMVGPSEFRGGSSLANQFGGKATRASYTHDFAPQVRAGLRPPLNGAIYGTLGDTVYGNAAIGWEEQGSIHGDIWRMMKAQTGAQGAGLWELILQPGTLNIAPIKLGALDNTRVGPGALVSGRPGMFFNYVEGTLAQPGSLIPNGANGATASADSGNTGATGYIEWRLNDIYPCRLDVMRVFRVTSCTAASHCSLGIGTHNLPAGMMGRVIVRNLQGVTGVNGDRQWTRNTVSAIYLENLDGTNLNTTGAGTWVANTGIAILCRFIAYGYVAGSSLSLSTGNWIVGDRFVNAGFASGDATEWICTETGIGTDATWVPLAVLP